MRTKEEKKNVSKMSKKIKILSGIWFGGAILCAILMQIPIIKKLVSLIGGSGIDRTIKEIVSRFIGYTGIPKLLNLIKTKLLLQTGIIEGVKKLVSQLVFLHGKTGIIILVLLAILLFHKILWKILKKVICYFRPVKKVISCTPKLASRTNWNLKVGATPRLTNKNRLFVRFIREDGLEEYLYDLSMNTVAAKDGITLVSDTGKAVTVYSSGKIILTVNKEDSWKRIPDTKWNIKII